MKYLSTFLLFGFIMCNSDLLPAQNFSGSFKGNQNGISSSAVIVVKNKQLAGTVIMDGIPGQVTGIVNDSIATGILFDSQAQKNYAYSGRLSGDELRISIVFPELNNKVVELIMQRESAGISSTVNMAPISTDPTGLHSGSKRPKSNNGTKNPALVGVWRFTEDFSSGSGDNYGSLSTEYFMQFKADGTILTWTGRSAGSGGDIGISAEGESVIDADKGEWYTEGKILYIIDQATKEKVSTLFYAEENRMMLHDGEGKRKVLMRVR